ncbi:hypothetical protein DMUE_2325 [Dictyocoela muelleri]|nr:hypothetical protein DMUE_2325 [Dictyocoela muelleri]
MSKISNNKLNIRHNSFFSSFKVEISILLEVIYYISKELRNFEIMHASIVKRITLLRIRALINKRTNLFFDSNPIRLGGPGAIVQVDKTKLNFNVKNHSGSTITPCWALCIVDTSYRPALGFCTIVEYRSANILLDIIYVSLSPIVLMHRRMVSIQGIRNITYL